MYARMASVKVSRNEPRDASGGRPDTSPQPDKDTHNATKLPLSQGLQRHARADSNPQPSDP